MRALAVAQGGPSASGAVDQRRPDHEQRRLIKEFLASQIGRGISDAQYTSLLVALADWEPAAPQPVGPYEQSAAASAPAPVETFAAASTSAPAPLIEEGAPTSADVAASPVAESVVEPALVEPALVEPAIVEPAAVVEQPAVATEAIAAPPLTAPPVPQVTASPPRRVREPSALRRWWVSRRGELSADLAVHGLAYLGVVALFVGVTGFVVFAFGSVKSNLRPVAELLVPTALFLAAFFLRRRGAVFVSRAVEILAGVVLALMFVTSLVDSAWPDAAGMALVVALVVTFAVLGGVYGLVARRRPESPLRYLVAPMWWLAVGAAALAFEATIPAGRGIASPFPAEWATVAAAISVTLVMCRRRLDGTVARATLYAAVPMAVLAEVLVLVAAARAGWPPIPVAVAGLASVATTELLAPLFGRRAVAVTLLESLVVVVTGTALGPALGSAWAGAVCAAGLVGVAQWQTWKRPNRVLLFVLLGAALVPLMLALGEPGPTMSVALAGTTWSVVRRLRPLASLPQAVPLVGLIVFPAMAASALAAEMRLDAALVVCAAVVIVVAVGVRFSRARADLGMGLWVPAAAGLVVIATLTDVGGRPWFLAAAAAGAAVAMILAPRWPCVRVWTTLAASAVAFAWAADAAQVSVGTASLVAVGVGTVVVAAMSVGRGATRGHIGVGGHLVALAGFVAALSDAEMHAHAAWTATTTGALALVTAGWAITTAVGEVRGCAVRDLFVRLGHWGRHPVAEGGEPGVWETAPALEAEGGQGGAAVAPVALLVACTFLAPAVSVATGLLTPPTTWLSVVAASVATVAVLGARVMPANRIVPVQVWSFGGLVLVGLGALGSLSTGWSAAAGPALVVVAVVACTPALRQTWMLWVAWIASGVVVVASARALGVPDHWLHLALFVWAAVALLGALALDDVLVGRRQPGQGVRQKELLPGFWLGVVFAPLALAPVYAEAPTTFGWWSLAGAAVAMAAAVLTRIGAVSTVTWVLACVAYGALAPWHPLTSPWTLVPAVAVLLAVAEVATDVAPFSWREAATPVEEPTSGADAPLTPPATRRGAWVRFGWDLPPFAVAHALALVALGSAVVYGWVPITFVATGLLSAAVAFRLRARLWMAAGVALLLVGAGASGPGWRTLALGATSLAATVWATRPRRAERVVAQVLGAGAAAAAWVSLADWQVWDREQFVVATTATAAAAVVALAGATRWARLGLDWLAAWAAVPVAGIAASGFLVVGADVARWPAEYCVAGALAVLAAGTALVAAPTGLGWLRAVAAVLAVVSGVVFADAAQVKGSPAGELAALVAVAVVMTGTAMALEVTGRARNWRWPALLVGAVASVLALTLAGAQWPDRAYLVAALLGVGMVLIGLGLLANRWLWIVACADLLAAWLLYASEALAGRSLWFTTPIGIAVLVAVGIARTDRRRAGRSASAVPLTVLDYAGMVLVVGPPLVQAVATSILYGLVAVGFGLGLAVFGVLTRVRRRLAFGMTTVPLALVLMMVSAAISQTPQLHGWVPWVIVAVLGLAAIFVAAFIEQGRRRAKEAIKRFGELTEGWE